MELILDGVKLMVIGMLTVFVFLLIMIFCMNLMAKILAPLAAKFEKPQEKPAAARNDDDALRAAAAAAVAAPSPPPPLPAASS